MRTPRITASLMLAAYLALVAISGRGVVLCVGADGHLALEFGCFGQACSAPETPGAALSTSQCGTCVDTPLAGDAARVAVQSERTASGTAHAVFAETAPTTVLPSVVAAASVHITPPTDLPSVLRTTVLLI